MVGGADRTAGIAGRYTGPTVTPPPGRKSGVRRRSKSRGAPTRLGDPPRRQRGGNISDPSLASPPPSRTSGPGNRPRRTRGGRGPSGHRRPPRMTGGVREGPPAPFACAYARARLPPLATGATSSPPPAAPPISPSGSMPGCRADIAKGRRHWRLPCPRRLPHSSFLRFGRR